MIKLVWSTTELDIETRLKIKYGFEQAKSTQEFQVLAKVVAAIFGGGDKPKPPESAAEAEAQFAGVFGKNAVIRGLPTRGR